MAQGFLWREDVLQAERLQFFSVLMNVIYVGGDKNIASRVNVCPNRMDVAPSTSPFLEMPRVKFFVSYALR